MKHFVTEEWIDFANELVAIQKRKEMEQHLEEDCSQCKKTLSLWQKVQQTAKSAAECQPPEQAVRVAKAAFLRARFANQPDCRRQSTWNRRFNLARRAREWA